MIHEQQFEPSDTLPYRWRIERVSMPGHVEATHYVVHPDDRTDHIRDSFGVRSTVVVEDVDVRRYDGHSIIELNGYGDDGPVRLAIWGTEATDLLRMLTAATIAAGREEAHA